MIPPPPSQALDDESVRRAFAAACPGTRVLAVRPGPSGYTSRNTLVDTDEGPLLLKLPVRVTEPHHLRRLLVGTRLAAEGGVPVVRYRALHVDESVLGVPFVVQEFAPGTSASRAWPELGPDGQRRLATELGATVARLHAVPGPGFGRVLSGTSSWEDHLLVRLDELVADRASRGVELPEIGDVDRRLRSLVAELAPGPPPRLVHADLFLDNVLVRDGRLAALLDFEHARFADPLWDFVKLQELVFERLPGTEQWFLDGYREGRPNSEVEDRRLSLYSGLQYLSALVYFAEWEPRLVPVYRDRLVAWLGSSAAA